MDYYPPFLIESLNNKGKDKIKVIMGKEIESSDINRYISNTKHYILKY